MAFIRIRRDGSAREEALRRRNRAVREARWMGPKPEPIREPEKPDEQKADEKLSE
jgi:hypothetical protein